LELEGRDGATRRARAEEEAEAGLEEE